MTDIISLEKLNACKQARQIASKSFETVLGKLLQSSQPISEMLLRNLWLREMRKQKDIFTDGWYLPPPHGITILIGTPTSQGRHNYGSLRPKNMWPQKDNILDDIYNLLYIYASPVHRKTGVIGDFGMTIYFGNDQKVIKHLQTCLSLDQEIYEYMQIGMMFSEVYAFAQQKLKDLGLENNIVSSTDVTGTNIGHTIPASYEQWSSEEQSILERAEVDWNSVKEMISKKRVFINKNEQTRISAGMAITNEARPTASKNLNIPMASYHTIAMFYQSNKKELVANFDKIFKLVGMDYMLKQ